MARPLASDAVLPRLLCGVLAAFALVSAAAAAAAWHRYRVILALPFEHSPYGDGALVKADMWFGNLMGWRKALLAVSVILLIVWLNAMRDLADVLWPEGQRRSRAWLLFGWGLPIGNLFLPKMFVNDLWAAGLPSHRRGHPLLTARWLSVLVAVGSSGTALGAAARAVQAAQAGDQLRQNLTGNALFIGAAVLTIALVRRLNRMLNRALAE